MTAKYYINTIQNDKNIPVHVEQHSRTLTHQLAENDIEKVQALLNAADLFAIQSKIATKCISFNKLIKTSLFNYNIRHFYQTLFAFKSKVKGILKLRSINNEFTLDDEGNLFTHAASHYKINGITWSNEALNLMLKVLTEQQMRWAKVNLNNPKASVKDLLSIFLKLATGQSEIYPGDLVALYFYLEYVLPQVKESWESCLYVINTQVVKPLKINTDYYNMFYYSTWCRNKDEFKLGNLTLFKEPKKQLGNLLDLFTTNTTKLKFLQCIK